MSRTARTAASPSATPQEVPSPGRKGSFVLGLLLGLVLAIVVWGIVTAVGQGGGGGDIDLPDELTGLVAQEDPAARDADADDEERLEEVRKNIVAGYRFNEKRLAEAHDGAEAAVRVYVPRHDENGPQLNVTVVRAESGPVLPYSFDDPDRMGMAASMNELHIDGDVQCILTRSNPPAKSEAGADDPDSERLKPDGVHCQRGDGDTTVRVLGMVDATVDQVVEATNELWDEVS